MFDKINQSINSAYDFISEAKYLKITDHSYFSLIFPVLVVPDNTLWQAKYDSQGVRQGKPELIKRASYFIGKEWWTGDIDGIAYSISHLEIVTFSNLENFVRNYLLGHLESCDWAIMDGSEIRRITK